MFNKAILKNFVSKQLEKQAAEQAKQQAMQQQQMPPQGMMPPQQQPQDGFARFEGIPMYQEGSQVTPEIEEDMMYNQPSEEVVKGKDGWDYKKVTDPFTGQITYFTKRRNAQNWMDLQEPGNEIPLRATKADIFGDETDQWHGTSDEAKWDAKMRTMYLNDQAKKKAAANRSTVISSSDNKYPTIDEILSGGYNTRIINYGMGDELMLPGHIEAVLIDPSGNPVPYYIDREGNVKEAGVNRWMQSGNPNVTEGSRFSNMTRSQLENYILNNGTNRSAFDRKMTPAELETFLRVSASEDERPYSLMDDNCADGVCRAFNIDPDSVGETRGLGWIGTDPYNVYETLYNQGKALPNSLIGRTPGTRSRSQELRNMLGPGMAHLYKEKLKDNPYIPDALEQTIPALGYYYGRDLIDKGEAVYNIGNKLGEYLGLWEDGGDINIDPSKRGTFKAQATRMGMSVQEAANTILNAPEGRYSPEMRKKANFAKNFAKEEGGSVRKLKLPKAQDGGFNWGPTDPAERKKLYNYRADQEAPDMILTLKDDKEFIDGIANWGMVSGIDRVNPAFNDQIKNRLYSGKWGYNPKTGYLVNLAKAKAQDKVTSLPESEKKYLKDRETFWKDEMADFEKDRVPVTIADTEAWVPDFEFQTYNGTMNALDVMRRNQESGSYGQTVYMTPQEKATYEKKMMQNNWEHTVDHPLWTLPGQIYLGAFAGPAMLTNTMRGAKPVLNTAKNIYNTYGRSSKLLDKGVRAVTQNSPRAQQALLKGSKYGTIDNALALKSPYIAYQGAKSFYNDPSWSSAGMAAYGTAGSLWPFLSPKFMGQ